MLLNHHHQVFNCGVWVLPLLLLLLITPILKVVGRLWFVCNILKHMQLSNNFSSGALDTQFSQVWC
jgi:hypothetical protein